MNLRIEDPMQDKLIIEGWSKKGVSPTKTTVSSVSDWVNSLIENQVSRVSNNNTPWITRKTLIIQTNIDNSLSLFDRQIKEWNLFEALSTIVNINKVVEENIWTLEEVFLSERNLETKLEHTLFLCFEAFWRWNLTNNELFYINVWNLVKWDQKARLLAFFRIVDSVWDYILSQNDETLNWILELLKSMKDNSDFFNRLLAYLSFRLKTTSEYIEAENIQTFAKKIEQIPADRRFQSMIYQKFLWRDANNHIRYLRKQA